MKSLTIALLLTLTGCSTASQVIPSLKYCDYVFYERIERNFEIKASCTLPAEIEAPL